MEVAFLALMAVLAIVVCVVVVVLVALVSKAQHRRSEQNASAPPGWNLPPREPASRSRSTSASSARRSERRRSVAPRSDGPVQVRSSSRSGIQFEIRTSPAGHDSRSDPKVKASDCWMPPGQPVMVQGRAIRGGMLYVGRGLAAASRWSGLEPALINPKLKVDNSSPDTTCETMGYWPSYAGISPGARAAYLDWLAGGRIDPAVGIGHVFLFFYGLERRLLVDAAANPDPSELAAISAEVRRLLELYGGNGSFYNYANGLLGYLGFLRKADGSTAGFQPPRVRTYWDVPLQVKLGLGGMSLRGEPIPANWALAWGIHHPETRLRTPAKRCPDELSELFAVRYREKFGEGLVVKPNRRKLRASYRPASSGLSGHDFEAGSELPDICSLKSPSNKLRALVESCTAELDSYSRWLGRNSDKAGSIEAMAFLPAPLVHPEQHEQLRAIDRRIRAALIGVEHALLPASELLRWWPPASSGKFTKKDAVALISLIERLGFGVEPDPRFGAPRLDKAEQAVVFPLGPDSPDSPSAAYAAATLTLHLASAVSTADGAVASAEEELLERHLEENLNLDRAERTRLRAHLMWLLADHPGMAGLKKRLESMTPAQREAIGMLLLSVAAADGRIDPKEVRILRRCYGLLGLDPERVFEDVHALSAPTAPTPKRKKRTPGSTVGDGGGAGTAPAVPPRTGFQLDEAAIQARLQETESVARLLGTIFEDDDEPSGSHAATELDASVELLAHLDAPHSAFTRKLVEKEEWARDELEALAEDHGLMLDGALETVNEAAFEACGEPLHEGEDPVEVYPEIIEEMSP